MPSTATLPFTAGPQSAAYVSASEGTVVEHVPEVDGSPMMIAVNPPKYVIICAVVIPLTALDENIVTVHPSAAAFAASAEDEPPLTLLGNTSTEPEHVVDAFAGADLATAVATANTAALAAADAWDGHAAESHHRCEQGR